MSIPVIILIILIGFILLFIEFFIIPGISVAGIASLVVFALGIFFGYHFHGKTTGNIILIITGLTIIAFFIVMIKLKAWHNIGLKSTIDSKVGVIGENDVKPGDEGTTVSKLAPMGKAIINGKIFEVSSFGNYIETNVNVIVTSVERNKIYVEIKN